MTGNENNSLTEIVNSALVQLGDRPILDIEDLNDGRAAISRVLLRQCIREVESHPSCCWTELIEDEELTFRGRAVLASVSDGDIYEWNVPLNLLSIVGVFDGSGRRIEYRYIGGKIRTKEKAKFIRYVRYNETPGAWSSELKSCVIGLLRSKMIGAIMKDVQGSIQMVEAFWKGEFKRFAGDRAVVGRRRGMNGSDNDYRRFYDESGGVDDGYMGLGKTSY